MPEIYELPDAEFLAAIQNAKPRGADPAAPARGAALPPSVTPDTQAALAKASDMFKIVIPQGEVTPEMGKKGARPGVFLNEEEGVPMGVRVALGADQKRLNQFKVLVSAYGPENVEMSPEGRFILRNQPAPGGILEDRVVNPEGPDWGDVAELGGQGGYLAGGMGGAALGLATKNPIARMIYSAIGMGVGGAIGGGAQDVLVRLKRGHPVELGELSLVRAGQAGVDAGIGLAAAGVGKLLTKGVEGGLGFVGVANDSKLGQQLGMRPSPTQVAAAELEGATGVKYPLSPGEAAGANTGIGRFFIRGEATAAGRVGSTSMIDKALNAKQKAEDELKRIFFGLPRTLTDDELAAAMPSASGTGERALQTLRKEAEGLSGTAQRAAEDLAAFETGQAQKLAGVNLSNALDPTVVGKGVRQRVVSDFEQGKSTLGKRYSDFFEQPELQARTVAGDDLAKAATQVEEKLTPQAMRKRIVESEVLDAQGNPITYETQELERLDAFLDGKVKTLLDEMKGLQGAQVSVNDLKLMRTRVDSAIAEGTAIPGVDTKQLKTLHRGLTDAMGNALDKINPALKKEWNALNTDYATHIGRFDKTGIRELLIAEGEKRSVGNTAIAERVIGDSAHAKDIYLGYKEFLGANSPEFSSLKRVIAESALVRAPSDVTPFIDGGRLRAGLRNLRPEIAEEVLGKNRAELAKVGEVLEAAQAKNIDVEELKRLLNSRTGLTADGLRNLIKAETDRTVAYNNKLIRAAADGTLDAETIRPSDFVRHASNLDPKEAQRIMGILGTDPALVQDINRIALDRIFSMAQAEASSGQHRLISPKLLTKVLEGSQPERAAEQMATWETLAGKDGLKGLLKLAETVASRNFDVQSFKGGLSKQMDMNRLFLNGEIGSIPAVAKRWLLATLYSGPLKKMTTNLIVSQDRGNFLNAIIGSTPFIDATTGTFGIRAAGDMMNYYRTVVEPEQRMQLNVEGKLKGDKDFDPSQLSDDKFQQWMNNSLAQ